MSRWFAHYEIGMFGRGELFVGHRNADDSHDVVQPFVLERIEPGVRFPFPTAMGQDAEEFMRAMLNAAWEAGLRPDGFNDTRESMKATIAHLQDMRAIAFHAVQAPKP